MAAQLIKHDLPCIVEVDTLKRTIENVFYDGSKKINRILETMKRDIERNIQELEKVIKIPSYHI